MDRERAAEIAGSRFAYLMGDAVLLEFALLQWVLAKVVAAGHTPVVPPVLVRERTMEEAGFFPTDRAQVYEVDGGELFLVGTAKCRLACCIGSETLTADACRSRYAGLLVVLSSRGGHLRQGHARHLPGAPVRQGRDVRPTASPSDSLEEHERILAIEGEIVGGLGLPYRVVERGGRRPRSGRREEVRHRSVASVRRSLPRGHVVLELPRLLRPPARVRA